jgi:hypothetical protein
MAALNEEVERVTYVYPEEVAARHKREEETPLDDEIYINWIRDKNGNFVRINSNRGGSFISEIQIHAASR